MRAQRLLAVLAVGTLLLLQHCKAARSVSRVCFVVKVAKEQAKQVEASYTQQGYHVEHNEQFGFLVVSELDSTATAAAAAAAAADDYQAGRAAEGTPYGVSLVEADTPTMLYISKSHKDNVLFCVIDTGLDRANPEFDLTTTSGCMPGAVRTDGTVHACRYNWFEDHDSHGTHTSGSIAARRNGQGIVGVSAEGANMYHYNIFGPQEAFSLTDSITAIGDCIRELDSRKGSSGNRAMKLVVSMSFGGNSSVSVMGDVFKAIAAERADVLLVASAGNTGDGSVSYPAGYPEVVSVGAVAWDELVTDFSSFNSDVEWAGPGLGVLSTVPVWAAPNSSYNMVGQLTVNPADAISPQLLSKPPMVVMGGSARGIITTGMYDCGLANQTCFGAEGRICLIQRGGGVTFCNKVLNCTAGGGLAAVIYGSEADSECQMLFASLSCSAQAATGSQGGWPIVLTAARAQGKALRDALAANPGMLVTLDAGSGTAALELLSGTSMSTPIAAGVAGLVWSAHTNCSAADLRAAITATAKGAGAPGRDVYYGNGIVKALAAHTYLAANPCTPPPPPAPVDCVGGWEWGECSQSCGGGVATAWFTVSTPASNGGKPCEAEPNAMKSKTCNAQSCGQAVDDYVTAVSGQWTPIDVSANDKGDIIDISGPSTPQRGSARLSSSRAATQQSQPQPPGEIMYKAPAGWTGLDVFQYSAFTSDGKETQATVSVRVVAGSCAGHRCIAGSCVEGQCKCSPATGLTPTFVKNPDRSAAATTPMVPACRYRMVNPVAPFNLEAVRAAKGTKVAIAFALSSSQQCFKGQVVSRVSFAKARGCGTYAAAGAWLAAAPRRVRAGLSSCSQGQFSHVFWAPAVAGCYNMSVELADGSKVMTKLRAV
ncbi:hypothetical protein OEZ86_000338 [Tetradesmus obliquus]|nr:hypothetical protein OEZ86_000338 [Tetradesmus obliquus]